MKKEIKKNLVKNPSIYIVQVVPSFRCYLSVIWKNSHVCYCLPVPLMWETEIHGLISNTYVSCDLKSGLLEKNGLSLRSLYAKHKIMSVARCCKIYIFVERKLRGHKSKLWTQKRQFTYRSSKTKHKYSIKN